VHLAGVAAIPNAVANMRSTWRVQLFGTLNVAQAILQTVPDCCLIYASSGQIYGASARYLPVLNEQAPLSPTNVYTASKAAADLALGAMVEIGLKVVRFRPFNHTGPKQSEDFVIPSFAMQIARIRAGFVLPVIKVGNLDVERDFLDVRDVASAYVRAIERSEEIGSGTVFNIASGKGQRIRDLLNRMIELSGLTISVVEDNTRVRNHDIARFVGDASKAKMELGWSPHYTFDDTLREMLSYAEIAVLSSAVGLQDGK
jgi:GDP-4-dehydro-6-deoxy-D-mannose reductase